MSDGGMGADHINIDQVESYLSWKETLVKTAILKIFTVDSALGQTVTFNIFTVDSALRGNKSLKMKSIEREIKPGEKPLQRKVLDWRSCELFLNDHDHFQSVHQELVAVCVSCIYMLS